MEFKVDHWDALTGAGLLLALAGLAWVHPGMALVGVGAGLAAGGVWGARHWGDRRAE